MLLNLLILALSAVPSGYELTPSVARLTYGISLSQSQYALLGKNLSLAKPALWEKEHDRVGFLASLNHENQGGQKTSSLALDMDAFQSPLTQIPFGMGVAFGNDYFAFTQERNDRGFTTDIDAYMFGYWRGLSDKRGFAGKIQLGIRYSMFTEDADDSDKRFDLSRMYVLTQTPVALFGPLKFTLVQYTEGVWRGNLGGSHLQSTVHEIPGIHGGTLGDGLQDKYPSEPRLGLCVGAGGTMELDLSLATRNLFTSWTLGTLGQWAPFRTGFSKIEMETGMKAEVPVASGVLFFSGISASVGMVSSNDPALQLRGAYTNEMGPLWGPDIQVGLRIRMAGNKWTSLFFRFMRNDDGVGSWNGSGSVGWIGMEFGEKPWSQSGS